MYCCTSERKIDFCTIFDVFVWKNTFVHQERWDLSRLVRFVDARIAVYWTSDKPQFRSLYTNKLISTIRITYVSSRRFFFCYCIMNYEKYLNCFNHLKTFCACDRHFQVCSSPFPGFYLYTILGFILHSFRTSLYFIPIMAWFWMIQK